MKKSILIILLTLFVVSCKTQSNIVTSKKEAQKKGLYAYNSSKKTPSINDDTTKKKSKKNKKSNATLNDKIVTDALDFVGVRYRLGGTTKTGMDCSGLVFSTFGNYNIVLPRTAIDMSKHGETISKKKATPGDLIFFKTNGRSKINHVGIITDIEDDVITFVHASTSSGVIVSSTLDEYYSKTFAQINRVIN
ncbi:C40 family peptidase [Flavobacterium chuncheonense]|uniref:C40 family peptidase n=1 Tax=Flavobacterium chuncheonense TaxID=2026653 RepID=A0ABW5YLS6_9FLAO